MAAALVGAWCAASTSQNESDHEWGKPATHRILVPANLSAVKQVAGQ
jgi:hypothetical protein